MPLPFAQIMRDFVTDGVPSSGNNKPKKSELRSWGQWVESLISAFTSGSDGNVFLTRASLFGTLTGFVDFDMAWVVQDPTAAYNGIYQKNGGSGTGFWVRVADLPYSFIAASDVGAGTANAIQASSTIPISSSALVIMNVFRANTGPVTVSFNGGAPLTIKSNAGNDIPSGGLVPGLLLLGTVSGSAFRLASDINSAASQAAAEAAAAAASASASLAQQRFVRTRVVATSNVNIANGLEAGDAIDGVTLAAGDLVLLTGQTAPSQNGIYVAVVSGAASRSPQFSAFNDHPGTYVTVLEGAVNSGSRWQSFTPMGGTLGAAAITFALTSLSGQDGEGFLRGGGYANNATDANNDIDFAPLYCRDRDNTITFSRATSLTKQLDALWVAGTNAGGLDAGTKAINTWYNFHAIKNPTTGVEDVVFSTSMTNPDMTRPNAAGFTKRRWLGAALTDGSGNFIPFTNDNEWFRFKTDVVSASTVANGNVATLRQLAIPSGAKAEAEVYVQAFSSGGTNTGFLSVRDPDRGAFTASATTAIGFYGTGTAQFIQSIRISTDNVGRVYTGDSNNVDGRLNLRTIGWRIDRTQMR
ncbi:hypothetical protein [Rhizobium grahamii]|uniref:Tail fiber protein n=1 Tax=Rhizobium grahamii CCGE 502 TaxID=990285 RepID=S3HAU1_9HYPH|nr:hypothetical protein [Rhizobium grahamii]EPE95704.1 hypothetical protein RGCCGE502_22680 [Rhizobium grahamii CCGE 502]